MALDFQEFIFASQQWPQGDARDPLGVWGRRVIEVGDASGGGIQVRFAAPADIAGAFVYTCYSAAIGSINFLSNAEIQLRLLTNWPDIDPTPGVQGYGGIQMAVMDGTVNMVAPLSGPDRPLVNPQDRYILLYDPRPVAGAFDIVSFQIGENIDGGTVAFEAWGYYWDRQVLQTPGGPRHPGSN